MTFTAKLKRTSTIWTTWRENKRISGEVCGVIFRLAPGLDYVTAELTPAQVEVMKYHNAIVLEVTSRRMNGTHLAEPVENPLVPDFPAAVEEVTEPVRATQVTEPVRTRQVTEPVTATVLQHPRYQHQQRNRNKGRR